MKYLLILLSVLATVWLMESCNKDDKYATVTGRFMADSVGALGNMGCHVFRASTKDPSVAMVAGFYTDAQGYFNFKMRKARTGVVVITPDAPYTSDTFQLSRSQPVYDLGTVVLKRTQ